MAMPREQKGEASLEVQQVGSGHDQGSTGSQHPGQLAENRHLIADVLDSLRVQHSVEAPILVGKRLRHVHAIAGGPLQVAALGEEVSAANGESRAQQLAAVDPVSRRQVQDQPRLKVPPKALSHVVMDVRAARETREEPHDEILRVVAGGG